MRSPPPRTPVPRGRARRNMGPEPRRPAVRQGRGSDREDLTVSDLTFEIENQPGPAPRSARTVPP